MSSPIFLYPSLTENMLRRIRFQHKPYAISYVDNEGELHDLEYECTGDSGSALNLLHTDGQWTADKYGFILNRVFSLSNSNNLFGPSGIACRTAKLGIAVVWSSVDSRQRGAFPIAEFSFDEDSDSVEAEININMPAASVRGEVDFSTILYLAEKGTAAENEKHLANTTGFSFGELDIFKLKLDGTGSLFPVYEVDDKNQPLWYVRCDWTDPFSDQFAEAVSINLNTAHKSYKFIDRTNKVFCRQLLVEVMAGALCCIIEKVRKEQYLELILSADDNEQGTVAQAIRYFSDTLDWDYSTPEALSLSARKFFDERMPD